MKKAIYVFILNMLLISLFTTICQACIGARAAGMGHAGVASANDTTVVYWNPAILPWVQSGISIGIVRPYKYDYIAISYNKIGFVYVDEYWGPYTHVSIGHKLTPNFSIGSSIGIALDIDDIWKPYISPSIAWKTDKFTFGVLLQTMANLRPAISYHYNNWVLAAEYYDILDYYGSRRLRLGCEHQFSNLFLRCGTELTGEGVIKNVGLGYKINNISIDVSYDTMSKWTFSTSLLD